jgi:hypothetical protein
MPCSTNKLSCLGWVPRRDHQALAVDTTAPQPEGLSHLGTTSWRFLSPESNCRRQRSFRAASPGSDQPNRHVEPGNACRDFVYIAGRRGIDPKTDTFVERDEARVRRDFMNLKLIAESEGRPCAMPSGSRCTSLTCFASARWRTKSRPSYRAQCPPSQSRRYR